MKPYKKKTWHLLLAAMLFILGCVAPSLSQQPVSAPLPGAADTIIAQTAGAASTQTAQVLPTSTDTPTVTSTPRNTATITPTATSTVIFKINPPVIPGSSSGSGGSSGGGSSGGGNSGGGSADNYSCNLVSISPGSGTAFGARTSFDAKVKVSNSGKKSWDVNSVDYAYVNGTKFHSVSIYDLKTAVSPGSSTTLSIDMQAPKNSGVYSTTWGLKTGADNFFCTFTISIVVK